MINTITEENLITTHDRNIYQKIVYTKRENLGKVIRLTLKAVLFKLLWAKPKDTVVYLYFYLRKILNLVCFNLLSSSVYVQEDNRLYGSGLAKKQML